MFDFEVLNHPLSASSPPNQTCQRVWCIKTYVSPSLGISADASSHCHAMTFNPWQINNPSTQPSIRPSESTSPGYQCHWEAQAVDKYTTALTNRLVPAGRQMRLFDGSPGEKFRPQCQITSESLFSNGLHHKSLLWHFKTFLNPLKVTFRLNTVYLKCCDLKSVCRVFLSFSFQGQSVTPIRWSM